MLFRVRHRIILRGNFIGTNIKGVYEYDWSSSTTHTDLHPVLSSILLSIPNRIGNPGPLLIPHFDYALSVQYDAGNSAPIRWPSLA
jgi:hypothetical protein